MSVHISGLTGNAIFSLLTYEYLFYILFIYMFGGQTTKGRKENIFATVLDKSLNLFFVKIYMVKAFTVSIFCLLVCC